MYDYIGEAPRQGFEVSLSLSLSIYIYMYFYLFIYLCIFISTRLAACAEHAPRFWGAAWVLYYTIIYYTILYYTTLHYTILYYTIWVAAFCEGRRRLFESLARTKTENEKTIDTIEMRYETKEVMCLHICLYIYIYIYMYSCTYIYIYRERER